MRTISGKLRLSASDLMRFKGCRHATTLDLRHMEVGDVVPSADTDEAALLQRQGDAHELSFLLSLKSQGRDVIEVPKEGLSLEQSAALTCQAMRQGADVIFQGAFVKGAWGGYSDFLERVERPSDLGSWSYEVVDTKLKRKPDPKHVLQLALYSDPLADIQGSVPERAHLELGDGSRFTVQLSQVSAYSRHARSTLESFLKDRPETSPEPVSACAICRWKTHCQAEWSASDSLTLIAGITRSQRTKIQAAGVATMAALAQHPSSIPKLARETQRRLQTQARLQTERRGGGSPVFELREHEAGKGFSLLPQPDDGDVFYDIEGDPYFEGGLEYLHGLWYRAAGGWHFKALWAHDRLAEGQAVDELMRFLVDHLRKYPRAHIYHYANYEIAALRRLTAEHRLGEAAMDQLQREGRFVDLFKVVSGALICSEKGYSIKDLEAFYMEKRSADVATAGASVVFYEKWRETGDGELLAQIHDYNRTDCISTQLLRDWLIRDVRPATLAWPNPTNSLADESLANVAAEEESLARLKERLEPVSQRLGTQVATLLADLSQFYKREDKPGWWAIYDRLAQDSEVLLDDLDCVFGLEAISDPIKVTAKSFERTYRYPAQETKLRTGKKPCVKPAAQPEPIDLRSLDATLRTIVLRRSSAKGELPDSLHLLPEKPRDKRVLQAALAQMIETHIERPGQARAIEQFLARRPPTLAEGQSLRRDEHRAGQLSQQITDAVASLDHSTLGIQGPPGTGKTYVSALAIIGLVRAGKRVAVSSNSHKAITNLLKAVAARAADEGVPCRVVQKSSEDEDDDCTGIEFVSDNDAPELSAANVVGATAWHFARYSTPGFDHLIIDEAGQVSLANVLAMAGAARNLVLVGDPLQLPQPLQGTHPGESGQSCLEYLLNGKRVIEESQGFFMPVTRRMHPLVCAYISEAVYEGLLSTDEAASRQELVGTTGSSLAGVGVQTIAHAGCSQVSAEEISAIDAAITSLVGTNYRCRNGTIRTIAHSDILVVAPYNAQVNALRAILPAAVRVGTVDRFQGQEAPICLVSMTTSSSEEMPRDISFLFSVNRINVAVSRAQARAVVFASPQLLETPCRTVEEMTLVNGLCLLLEHGRKGIASDSL